MGAAERRPAPRLAGFITATNRWPDKSSYFILPSFTSAPLHPSVPPSSSSSLDSPLRTAAPPCQFLLFSSPPQTISPLFSTSFSRRSQAATSPALHLPLPSAPSLLLPCSMMNLQTEANNCTSAQVPPPSFAFESCDGQRAAPCFSLRSPPRPSLSSPLSVLSSHNGYVK